MAQQIQDLVASIRKDGIEAAQKEAARIIAEANEKAASIVEEAKKEASALLESAKKEMASLQTSARSNVQQAARDVQLSLKKALQDQLDKVLVAKVEKSLTGAELVSLISNVVANLNDAANQDVQLNKKEYDKLAKSLAAELGDSIKKGLEIKPVDSVKTGFKVVQKDGAAYYDFSADEVAMLLKPFLSPSIEEIVFSKAE